MVDVELVIKIPEETYEAIMADNYKNQPQKAENDLLVLLNSLDTATPLSKGHGRLIDADEIQFENNEFDTYSDYSRAFDAIDYAPTVIEADEEVEE